MDLRSWIPERFTPVVMVITTPEAEEMVQLSNGLTIVEMLRPQGAFRNLSGAILQATVKRQDKLAHQLCSFSISNKKAKLARSARAHGRRAVIPHTRAAAAPALCVVAVPACAGGAPAASQLRQWLSFCSLKGSLAAAEDWHCLPSSGAG